MAASALNLLPGKSLGPFRLGQPVADALAAVEDAAHGGSAGGEGGEGESEDAALAALASSLQVRYDAEAPLAADLVLSFPAGGFHLRFDPRSQRLRLIEVYDVARCKLRYSRRPVGGAPAHATFQHLAATLGPTFPGAFDARRCAYVLRYPGLALHFPIPKQHAAAVAAEAARPGAAHPLELPDGTTPVCARMLLHAGGAEDDPAEAAPPALPHAVLPLHYMETVTCVLGKGLRFEASGHELAFGAGAQDVWAALGPPDAECSRADDAMGIHAAAAGPEGDAAGSSEQGGVRAEDRFWNYFSRGVDLLLDGETHTLKKVVVHANWPGHPDFNAYAKCNFVLAEGPSSGANGTQCGADGGDKDQQPRRVLATVDSNWREAAAALGPAGPPAVHMGADGNPFGHTWVYGCRHAAVEVMSNGALASVTLSAG